METTVITVNYTIVKRFRTTQEILRRTYDNSPSAMTQALYKEYPNLKGYKYDFNLITDYAKDIHDFELLFYTETPPTFTTTDE